MTKKISSVRAEASMSGGRMHFQLFNEGDTMCVLSYLDLSGLVGNLSVCLKPGPNCHKYKAEFREHT